MSFECKNITITLRKNNLSEKKVLFKNFSYRVDNGKVLTIMGGSGTGKSTFFNYITNIYDRSAFHCEGDICVDEKSIIHLKTEHRKIGLLSQSGLLFPHMTVSENLIYAVPHKVKKSEREEIVHRILEEAHLDKSFEKKYPYTLSGGQQARLSLARTILSQPRILLLDEPFSKLDEDLRETIRNYVWQKVEEYNIPALLITHDKHDIYDSNLLYTLKRN